MKIGQLCCRLCSFSAHTMLTAAQLCFIHMTCRTDDGFVLMTCHMVESCVGICCRAGLQKYDLVCCDIHCAERVTVPAFLLGASGSSNSLSQPTGSLRVNHKAEHRSSASKYIIHGIQHHLNPTAVVVHDMQACSCGHIPQADLRSGD